MDGFKAKLEEAAKKKPEGGEAKPGDEKKPEGGEKKPEGGEKKPEGGEKNPEGGEKKIEGGEKKPDNKDDSSDEEMPPVMSPPEPGKKPRDPKKPDDPYPLDAVIPETPPTGLSTSTATADDVEYTIDVVGPLRITIAPKRLLVGGYEPVAKKPKIPIPRSAPEDPAGLPLPPLGRDPPKPPAAPAVGPAVGPVGAPPGIFAPIAGPKVLSAEEKEKLKRQFWLDDLESIRRPEKLFEGTETYYTIAKGPNLAGEIPKGDPKKPEGKKKPVVIDIGEGGSGDGGGGPVKKPEKEKKGAEDAGKRRFLEYLKGAGGELPGDPIEDPPAGDEGGGPIEKPEKKKKWAAGGELPGDPIEDPPAGDEGGGPIKKPEEEKKKPGELPDDPFEGIDDEPEAQIDPYRIEVTEVDLTMDLDDDYEAFAGVAQVRNLRSRYIERFDDDEMDIDMASSSSASEEATSSDESISESDESESSADYERESPQLRLRGGGPKKGTKKKKKQAEPEVEEEPDAIDFYQRGATNESLRFQDRWNDKGIIPRPGAPRIWEERLNEVFNQRPSALVRDCEAHPSYQNLHEAENVVDLDTAIATEWKADPDRCPLIKGLPMVEEIVFYRRYNDVDAGLCYWGAISALVYGSSRFWARVKSEHLQFYETVLQNENHPRHQTYLKMNSDFYTTSVWLSKTENNVILNLYQILLVRGAWAPSSMLTVTADLYNIFLVMYSIRDEAGSHTVDGMETKGAFNARHCFLVFTGNHYQPITPNDFYSYEFQLPRITQAVAEKYKPSRTGKVYKSIELPLRREADKKVPSSLAVDHAFDPRSIKTIIDAPKPKK